MSSSSTVTSRKDKKVTLNAPRAEDEPILVAAVKDEKYHPAVHEQLAKDIFLLLLGFRFVNALCIATFFQPDEYFQSLEPAWQITFGKDSGAWITWEWEHQLRSSLHPAIFAVFYFAFDNLMNSVALFPQFRAMILVVLPRVYQGLAAAAADYCTWSLAERIYGQGSNTAWVALLITMANPWQWFCSTRTFSNSLEMALTIVALRYWPWGFSGEPSNVSGKPSAKTPPAKTTSAGIFSAAKDIRSVRICLILAGFACILRPTNLLIWVPLLTTSITRLGLTGTSRVTSTDQIIFLREIVLCGAVVIALSAASDRLYFGEWTFPPYQWLNFNISQSLAVFYGTNDWHYYFTQGLPLLLTTLLPFLFSPLWSSAGSASISPYINNVRFQLSFTVMSMILVLSQIAHKEVRFIYPVLPILHIILAPQVLAFFTATPLNTVINKTSVHTTFTIPPLRRLILSSLILFNILLGLYSTQIHQRGVIKVLSFLRHEYESLYLSQRGLLLPSSPQDYRYSNGYMRVDHSDTFAAFLMPCHSTPWRSQLIYPTLHAWALTCEPPLHLGAGTPERAAYRDEADRFYDDPVGFLKREVNTKDRPWPRYVVGFEGIEEPLREYYQQVMPGWVVREKWSGFNSHFIDDSRRAGRVKVWEFVDGSKLEEEVDTK